jgi:hypothetical protein
MQPTLRPVAPEDLAVLIGLLAVLEGHLLAGDVPDHLRRRLAERFRRLGMLPEPGDEVALREALDDLNHRLRSALGEYDAP